MDRVRFAINIRLHLLCINPSKRWWRKQQQNQVRNQQIKGHVLIYPKPCIRRDRATGTQIKRFAIMSKPQQESKRHFIQNRKLVFQDQSVYNYHHHSISFCIPTTIAINFKLTAYQCKFCQLLYRFAVPLDKCIQMIRGCCCISVHNHHC